MIDHVDRAFDDARGPGLEPRGSGRVRCWAPSALVLPMLPAGGSARPLVAQPGM
jgi:hypothetical protein